jgi:hypothetical protein
MQGTAAATLRPAIMRCPRSETFRRNRCTGSPTMSGHRNAVASVAEGAVFPNLGVVRSTVGDINTAATGDFPWPSPAGSTGKLARCQSLSRHPTSCPGCLAGSE